MALDVHNGRATPAPGGQTVHADSAPRARPPRAATVTFGSAEARSQIKQRWIDDLYAHVGPAVEARRHVLSDVTEVAVRAVLEEIYDAVAALNKPEDYLLSLTATIRSDPARLVERVVMHIARANTVDALPRAPGAVRRHSTLVSESDHQVFAFAWSLVTDAWTPTQPIEEIAGRARQFLIPETLAHVVAVPEPDSRLMWYRLCRWWAVDHLVLDLLGRIALHAGADCPQGMRLRLADLDWRPKLEEQLAATTLSLAEVEYIVYGAARFVSRPARPVELWQVGLLYYWHVSAVEASLQEAALKPFHDFAAMAIDQRPQIAATLSDWKNSPTYVVGQKVAEHVHRASKGSEDFSMVSVLLGNTLSRAAGAEQSDPVDEVVVRARSGAEWLVQMTSVARTLGMLPA